MMFLSIRSEKVKKTTRVQWKSTQICTPLYPLLKVRSSGTSLLGLGFLKTRQYIPKRQHLNDYQHLLYDFGTVAPFTFYYELLSLCSSAYLQCYSEVNSLNRNSVKVGSKSFNIRKNKLIRSTRKI